MIGNDTRLAGGGPGCVDEDATGIDFLACQQAEQALPLRVAASDAGDANMQPEADQVACHIGGSTGDLGLAC
jgi:hypothetical protein